MVRLKALSAIRKEMLEVVHDRTMLLVLLAFPVFVMLFMGSAFHSLEINGLPVGIYGPQNITASPLFSGLNQSQAFKLMSYSSEEEAMTAFRNGMLRAVILVPQDFEESLAKGNGSTVRIVVDNSDLALEQSVLAALSSVIEASSANITRSYVSSAWVELRGLNESASTLASGISSTRAQMQQTKASLADIRSGIDSLGIGSLGQSLDNASAEISGLRTLIAGQKAALADQSESNEALFNRTDEFLYNASFALNQSIGTVQDTHDKLESQASQLEATVGQLDLSISGLQAIKAGTSDPATIAALDLNIASLQALRDSAASQAADAHAEITSLEALNATLQSFGTELADYSETLAEARAGSASGSAEWSAALEQADGRLSTLNASFASARSQVGELDALLSGIRNATSQIESTLDSALEQTGAVDSLITSLEGTVAEQTGKDPNTIASPLSVEVENQYERGSYVDFIMPQVISVSLLLSCFLLGSISLVREKTRRTIVRALMVPGGLANLVAGKIVALVLLSVGQVAVILIVAALLFGVRPPADLASLVYGAGISALVLSSIGVLVGFYARSESAAIQSCLLLAIPMLFLGNIIFSPDLLPSYTQILQQLLPLAHVTSIFKIILITSGDPAFDVAALLSYFVIIFILMAYIVTKRKDITNYE